MSKKKNENLPEEEVKQAPPVEETPAEAVENAPEAPAADEAKAANERYLRLMAEYDNFRKRSAKERENIYTDVRAPNLRYLLHTIHGFGVPPAS